MKTDISGCSSCQNGEERIEFFTIRTKTRVQYDYRTSDGQLFSCVADNLDVAREKRDRWLEGKNR